MSDAAVNALLKCFWTLLPKGNFCPKNSVNLRIILKKKTLFGAMKYKTITFCNKCEKEYLSCGCERNSDVGFLVVFDLKVQFDKLVSSKFFVFQ